MASSTDYIEFICEQISDIGNIRYLKMFGEYIIYVNDKPILLICNNTVFIKKVEDIRELMKNSEVDIPYKGAKEHYILDIDDTELSKEVITTLESITPIPKRKNKK